MVLGRYLVLEHMEPWGDVLGVFGTDAALLLANLNQVTIIQKPCYLPYIPIMVPKMKCLKRDRE